MLNEIIKDATKNEAIIPHDEAISMVSQLCQDLNSTQFEIDDLESKLKEAKKKYEFISETQLPELLKQFGLRELKLTDGTKISTDKVYLAGITEDRREKAFNWLRENDCGHLIKEKLEIAFNKHKKGEADPEYQRIITVLTENEVAYAEKGDIHWQTLRAFVREQMTDPERSKDFPAELFGVYIKDVAKITKK